RITLSRDDCPHCEWLPLHALPSQKALFSEGDFACVPRGSGSWGSQVDLLEGMETDDPLSPSSPGRSGIRSQGSEARSAVSYPPGTASPQYEELLEVVTRAVAKLNIDWPAEKQAEPQQSKLDERFLRNRPSKFVDAALSHCDSNLHVQAI
ncbi:hypothetical protein M9458_014693, partial [Cirrhinus mrigala]